MLYGPSGNETDFGAQGVTFTACHNKQKTALKLHIVHELFEIKQLNSF
jgi:hypothetical protein